MDGHEDEGSQPPGLDGGQRHQARGLQGLVDAQCPVFRHKETSDNGKSEHRRAEWNLCNEERECEEGQPEKSNPELCVSGRRYRDY